MSVDIDTLRYVALDWAESFPGRWLRLFIGYTAVSKDISVVGIACRPTEPSNSDTLIQLFVAARSDPAGSYLSGTYDREDMIFAGAGGCMLQAEGMPTIVLPTQTSRGDLQPSFRWPGEEPEDLALPSLLSNNRALQTVASGFEQELPDTYDKLAELLNPPPDQS